MNTISKRNEKTAFSTDKIVGVHHRRFRSPGVVEAPALDASNEDGSVDYDLTGSRDLPQLSSSHQYWLASGERLGDVLSWARRRIGL